MFRRTFLATLVAVAFSFPARAEQRFHALPPTPDSPKASELLGRVVRYDGNTNGQMVMEVKNPTAEPLMFVADGLFFVPAVDPDVAPQRLGAVGGFDARGTKGQQQRQERYTVGAGESVQLRLDVFCIDSHRSSPTSATPFRIANTRLPPALTTRITETAREEADKVGGFAAPASKSSTQNSVWKNRDANWIKLQGESKQEAGK